MHFDFSSRGKMVYDNLIALAKENDSGSIGTEYLILAMYNVDDSLCKFLLNEYDVTKEEVEKKTLDVVVIRKKHDKFSAGYENIMKQAKLLAGDEAISDEHIFMAILMNRNTIASKILVSLDLNIDDLILDVKEIYDFNPKGKEIDYATNITLKAKNKKLSVFVDRKEYTERMMVILNRKYKNNPLLVGNAGVGKTALVEGYASNLLDMGSSDEVISLNLTSMLAGTKYRGDFEQRFDDFVKKITSKKNVILFIDEIHTIMGAGTTEGNLDVANMLKPFLARSDIKLIGATTLEEYHKSIEKDKALSRRFQPVFVEEPSLDETYNILLGIKPSYEEYHGVKITDTMLKYLLDESNRKITKRYRPDKCIDILDDVMAKNRILKQFIVSKDDIDDAINSFLGYKKKLDISHLNFPVFEKYEWLNSENLLDSNSLLKVKYIGKSNGLDKIESDIKSIFNISDEMILSIDLSMYKESFMLSSLIGAPPGYVGHEEEGLVSKHILKYPIPVLILKNFTYASSTIKKFFYSMLEKGFFYDSMGNHISIANSVFVIHAEKEKSNVGFIENIINDEDSIYNEIIEDYSISDKDYNKKYQEVLNRYNIEPTFTFKITKEIKKNFDEIVYKLIKQNKKGKLVFDLDNNKNVIFKDN